ncbi:MAG: HDOD domain-containing protein [Deltaproteobacteria bacterium]|jgi:putative nucleotidyltransferase with HDIG domain|nr:HDOD domain-containing protein [Deltaproteobacteria bacterium]
MKKRIRDPKKIIDRIDDLPTLPRTVLKITELVNDPKSSAKDLARVITDDQILTARLLKLVNSSFYGLPQRISTVTGAIVLIGFDAIRNLLLTTSVFDLFADRNRKRQQKQEKFWDHSLGCAVGAKVIGNYLRHDNIEELFVAGLLHDIGKIVEMMFQPDEFSKVVAAISRENILMITAENKILGYSHAEIGKLLAEKWNLPVKLIQITAHHHQPDVAGSFALEAAIVHLADIFCRALNMGFGGDNKIPPLDRFAWESLKIKTSAIESIMETMQDEYGDIRSFIS